MNWKEVRQRKEDSIRESTGNPMVKNPNPFDKNGKTYKSFSDYLKSDEYKEYLKIEEEALGQYQHKAKEYFISLNTDNQLLLFFYFTNIIFENYYVSDKYFNSVDIQERKKLTDDVRQAVDYLSKLWFELWWQNDTI